MPPLDPWKHGVTDLRIHDRPECLPDLHALAPQETHVPSDAPPPPPRAHEPPPNRKGNLNMSQASEAKHDTKICTLQ